jgi:pantetheine-phosphate adenylyltransferase
MMPSAPYTFLSSGMVREVSALGGSVHDLVPAVVERRLYEKLSRESPSIP